LEQAIAALESQRGTLGDAVVDAGISGLRRRIAVLAEAVLPPAVDTRQLRQVTILFLDVVSSTALSGHLDPETTGEVMDGFLTRATSTVQAHGGKVLQYAGDSLLAVFGAEEAREDDAERGVRCGLALLQLGHQVAGDIEAMHDWKQFGVRIGMHTGAVLLGGGVDAEGTIRGNAVAVAARMEQSAPPGALRISADTYGLVRGVFDVIGQPPLVVKGVDRPVATYLVERAKPRAFRIVTRGLEGVATRMVGRSGELARLMAAFDRVVAPGAGFASTLVVGEPGVGKSRLLHEMQIETEARPERFFVFQARAIPQTAGQPYGLLREILAWRLAIADGEPADVARRKFEETLVPLIEAGAKSTDAVEQVHLLGHVIGLDYNDSPVVRGIGDDARQIRSRAYQGAALALRRWAAQRGTPLVMWLDDLHWIDDASLSFLEHLAEVDADVPMLVIGSARPEFLEKWPRHEAKTRSRRLFAEKVELSPLAPAHSKDLIDQLLQRLPSVPGGLRELIAERTQGNPFFIEEIVRMLIDRGAIRASAADWQVDADRLLSVAVPPSLTGVLQARIDALSPPQRRVLQLASVIGVHFWDAALEHVEAGATVHLGELVRREFINRRPDSLADDDVREYAFRHHLLHQVVYDTVLKRVKRAAHSRVAEWLTEHSGARAKALSGNAAEHFESAGEYDRAAQRHATAAAYSAETFDNDAALHHAARALELAPPDARTLRWSVLAVRERMLDRLGRRSEQKRDIAALDEIAEVLDSDVHRADVAWRRSDVAMRTGDWATQETQARRAREIAERCGAQDIELKALQRLATAIAFMGNPKEGRSMAEAALKRAQASASLALQSRLANAALICAERDRDPMSVMNYARLGVSIARASGNRSSETIALGNLGNAYFKIGMLDEARQHLREAAEAARRMGDRAVEGNMLSVLSEASCLLGDVTAAAEAADQSALIAREVGSRFHLVQACWNCGNAQLGLGEFPRARHAFIECEAAAREVGAQELVLHAIDGQARVELAAGDDEGAARHVARLLGEAGLGSDVSIDADFDFTTCPNAEWDRLGHTLYRVWLARSDPRALGALSMAHAALQKAAGGISDPAIRRQFLYGVIEHRQIVKAWKSYRRAT
jgi:class 3 adenylate cyclase/tetratricopeptide (TPR) repeat protein